MPKARARKARVSPERGNPQAFLVIATRVGRRDTWRGSARIGPTATKGTEKERKVQMAVEGEMVVQAVTVVIMDHSRKGFEMHPSK